MENEMVFFYLAGVGVFGGFALGWFAAKEPDATGFKNCFKKGFAEMSVAAAFGFLWPLVLIAIPIVMTHARKSRPNAQAQPPAKASEASCSGSDGAQS